MKINSFYKNRYDNNIWNSMCLSTWQQFTYNDIIKEINWKNNLNILEVWVWPYWMIFKLKKEFKNHNYLWIDLDYNVLNYLNNNDFKWINNDISSDKIDLNDNSIDIVIFNEVIEHIFDCQHSINEIYRILKKGWKLYISTHNSFNFFMRLKYFLWNIPATSLDVTSSTMWEHIRLFNKYILLKLLNKWWFQNKDIINKSWFKLWRLSFYTKKFTGLLSIHLYFICKK